MRQDAFFAKSQNARYLGRHLSGILKKATKFSRPHILKDIP